MEAWRHDLRRRHNVCWFLRRRTSRNAIVGDTAFELLSHLSVKSYSYIFYSCYDGEGNSVSCSDCMKATSATVNCVITSGDGNNLGTPTACPGDPAPATRPDGSPNEIADGLVKTFCNSLIGWPGPFGFIQPAVCLAYSYAMANGDPYDEALEGATSLCDTFTIVSFHLFF